MKPQQRGWAPACVRTCARAGTVAMALLTLAACANFSPDAGMAAVSERVAAGIGVEARKLTGEEDFAAVRDRLAGYLSRPLTADVAVQVAVLNNRGLQAQYNTLGLSEAQYIAASLPANPTLGFLRMSGDGIVATEMHLSAELVSLLTVPIRRQLGEQQFEAAKFRAVDATFRLAADARRAFYRASAAQHVAVYLEHALETAATAAELTRRLAETGAATRLDQARAAALHLEVANQLRRARLDAQLSRETLSRLLGVWGPDIQYTLPAVLPALPRELQVVEDLEAEAVRRRVDLIAARHDLNATAQALGLTEATRFVSIVELSGIRGTDRGPDGATRTGGFEIAVQIPIFDLGEVRTRRAREMYMEAVNRLAERAINVRSEARAAFQAYHVTYDIARGYRDEIIPLRRIIDEEVLYRYNGMLIDVFQVLTTARESVASNIATIQAIRDFYIAETDFRAALLGGGGGPGGGEGTNVQAVPAASGGAGH